MAGVQSPVGNDDRMADFRTRLSDLPWFMWGLSEPIEPLAQLANRQ